MLHWWIFQSTKVIRVHLEQYSGARTTKVHHNPTPHKAKKILGETPNFKQNLKSRKPHDARQDFQVLHELMHTSLSTDQFWLLIIRLPIQNFLLFKERKLRKALIAGTGKLLNAQDN